MKNISKYINEQLSLVQQDKILYDFKKKIIAETTERVNALVKSGLTDMKTVEAIVLSEHPDVMLEYTRYRESITAKRKKGYNRKIRVIINVVSVLVITVLYLCVSFYTSKWSKTWLVFEGGFTILICAQLLLKVKSQLQREKPNLTAARILLAAAIMLISVFAFLTGLIAFSAAKSYMLIIMSIPVILIIDAIVACSFKKKLSAVSASVYLLLIAVLAYVVLSLLSIISWHPGWLIILFSVIADAIILLISYMKKNNSKI